MEFKQHFRKSVYKPSEYPLKEKLEENSHTQPHNMQVQKNFQIHE